MHQLQAQTSAPQHTSTTSQAGYQRVAQSYTTNQMQNMVGSYQSRDESVPRPSNLNSSMSRVSVSDIIIFG